MKFPAEDLKILLDACILHLLTIMANEAGKPKEGKVSVNSVGQYFTGLRSFFVDEHKKDINWKRYEKKFPKRIRSSCAAITLKRSKRCTRPLTRLTSRLSCWNTAAGYESER